MVYGRVLSSMFRYPGGKSRLKKQIVSVIKAYYAKDNCYTTCRYVEPFFGGGSIGRELLDSICSVAINDYDIGIAAFWHALINNPEELCEYVNSFTPTTDAFYEFKKIFLDEGLRDSVLIDKKYSLPHIGFMKMALHQISYSGLGAKSGGPLGGAAQKSDYKIDCRWSPENIDKKIWKLRSKLSRVNIFNNTCSFDDFEIFINDVLKESGYNFIYLDPPYYKKGPELYQFSFDEATHLRMADMLQSIDCPWLLSYDCSEEVKDIYKWAKIVEIDVTNTINTKNGSVSKKELLIVNKKYKYLLE